LDRALPSLPANATPAESAQVPDVLNLRTAIALTLKNNPSLQGAAEEIRAREAERQQAGRLPNPEISASEENVSGSGPYARFNSAETTIELSQLVELGGDRTSRVNAATARHKLAGWDYEAQRLRVLTQATERFIDVLTAQRRVALDQRLVQIAKRSETAATKRVSAGEASPIDRSRSQILVAQAQSQLDADQSELTATRRQLASLWGADHAQFAKVVGRFPAIQKLPSQSSLQQYLRDNPTLARYADELESRRADLSLARAKAIPDLTIGLGGRHFADSGDNALVASVSMPLPVFDQNQGNTAAARRRLDGALDNQREAQNKLKASLSAAYGRLAAAHKRQQNLAERILPTAQSVFKSVSTGYREGKFDLLQLIDAQRSLFEAKLAAIQAKSEFFKAKTEVEGLIGRSLEAAAGVSTGSLGGRNHKDH